MKRTKFVALMALVLCAVMLLASCGTAKTQKDPRNVKALKYDQLIKSYSQPESKETAVIEKIDVKGTVRRYSGTIYLFTDTEEKTTTVYNAKLGKVLYTCTDAEKFENDDITVTLSNYYFTVEDDVDDTTALYAGDGTLVATVPYSGASVTTNSDLILFGEKIYRRGEKDDAVYTLTAVEGADPRLPILLGTILEKTDDYYYTLSARGASGKTNPVSILLVYDHSLKLVASYTPDPGANSVQAFVLDDGNVVFQYRYRLPADAKEYTYCNNNGTEKYNVKTEIYNLKKNTTKEVDFPYAISAIQGASALLKEADDAIELAKGVSNLAFVYPIVNQRLGSNMDAMYLSVGNDLSVKGRLDAMVDMQAPASIVRPFNNDVRAYTLADGTYMVTDAKDKEIGRIVTGAEFQKNFIILNGVFYDYSLNVIFDCEANGFTMMNIFDNFAILTKKNEAGTANDTYRWTPGSEPEKIIDGESDIYYETIGGGYCIIDETDATNWKITYYDAKGNALLATENLSLIEQAMGSATSGAVYRATDAELKTVYYRVYVPYVD